MTAQRPHSRLLRSALVLATLLLASRAWGDATLQERYQRLKHGLLTTLPDTAISLASGEQDEVLSAEVSSILPHPFEQLSTALAEAENWCRFMPLHFNIKACTHQQDENGALLNIYSGRKHYQTPQQSYQMAYRFELLEQDENHLKLQLSAARGPAGTRDYRIMLAAMKVEEGTLLYIQSSYRPSMLSSLLTSSYLATLGRNKIGFSQVEKGGALQPVSGIRGVIERNVMRYHLAIDAFLATPSQGDNADHAAMLQRWIALNEKYAPQLHEMDREEYLAIKRKEWENQRSLQQALDERIRLAATP